MNVNNFMKLLYILVVSDAMRRLEEFGKTNSSAIRRCIISAMRATILCTPDCAQFIPNWVEKLLGMRKD